MMAAFGARHRNTGLVILLIVVVMALLARPLARRPIGAGVIAGLEPGRQLTLPTHGAGTPTPEEIPWSHDPDFLRAQQEHNTPVMLAAFRTVLHSPIAGEEYNIALATRRLSGTTVASGASFSLNRALGPYTTANGFVPGPNYVGNRIVLDAGGGVCKIATMLYNLTVLSDLAVVQRRAHTMVVPYVPPGQDATVSYTAWVDYSFRNTTPSRILIWGQKVGKSVFMAFYGRQKGPDVTWGHEVISYAPAPTVMRFNPNLAPDEKREVFPGFDGYVVRSWAEVTHPDGRRVIKPLGTSSYAVAARVVEYGPPGDSHASHP